MVADPMPASPAPTGGGSSSDKDVQENKGMAIIAYFWLLCLIPLLAKKDSPYAVFHGKQGLALAIAQTVWWLAAFVLVFIPVFGLFILWIGWILLLILWIMGIVNAASGRMKELPVIGGLTKGINL